MVPLGVDNISPISLYMLGNHRIVTLGMDVVKINKIIFLVTTSRLIRLATAAEMVSTKIGPIVEEVVLVVHMYNARGFIVAAIAGDNLFTHMRGYENFIELNVVFNPTSEDEYELYSEKLNRTLK